MANSVSSNIGNYVRDVGNSRGAIAGNKVRGPSGKETNEKKATGISNLFGDSAKVEFSPEVEMFGKVVDLLQKKYDNADVFVAGPGDDLSQIGGDLEYSIILSEDEMKLLSSDAPQDKEAKDKLLGQIDDAMSKISDLGKKIGENTNEKDEVSNFGISLDKNGKLNFFADINGKSYADTSMDALVKSLVSDKTAQN
ncbi:hypothetical protein bpr_I1472 [Butyrivibrio proteoclasticus B316]|uniref:Uncharacterized protein n=1 Tax=Butyrivibrio proteoclasticus (strain ATCC 51982 / DSM 14932 / B316) TaxID=515622 RepID=E0RWB1_BUTPB|nr:DUF6033 family protein [Butyrivibrio proteoclasticus]ADL34209.1 hypothetical protein bpr_I1472 [Butyrivibrio proteoclasticus B316]